MKHLYTHAELCTGCRQCSIACSLKKFGENNPKKAAITVIRDEFQRYEFPLVCMQCDDPLCIRMCPQNAITLVGGIVQRDKEKCIGCRMCESRCPKKAITMVEASAAAAKKPVKAQEPVAV